MIWLKNATGNQFVGHAKHTLTFFLDSNFHFIRRNFLHTLKFLVVYLVEIQFSSVKNGLIVFPHIKINNVIGDVVKEIRKQPFATFFSMD